jgi:pantoate--beta-alanine ligase
MITVSGLEEMSRLMAERRENGRTIGFVPTMGSLHEGHVSLIQAARKACDAVAVSIFVNPAQFGPSEDFKTYPRDIDGDTVKCRDAGAEVLFFPAAGVIYPEGYKTRVTVEGLSDVLCGASRPGHFQGVATVVLKLLNIVNPQVLFLGKKDFQQTVILRKMVRDLNMDAAVEVCPTVREADGLAMSSRNAYLSPEERKAAAVLFQALKAGEAAFQRGTVKRAALEEILHQVLESEPLVRVEYIGIVHPETLEEVSEAVDGTVAALAVRLGKARLIDNWTLKKEEHL